MQTYIVQSGNTLYGIAREFGISVDTLKRVNNITDQNLSVGQKLIIPNYNSTNYVVQKGDNLYTIAKKYNTTPELIINANLLPNDNLDIGQILVIPINNDMQNNNNQFKYTVKAGDNLYDIAKRYNTTVDNIKALNNLENNNLSIGQVLLLQANNTSKAPNTYVVKDDDTLYSIAQKFNIPINTLVESNQLTSPILNVGQKLIINDNQYVLPTVIKECYGNSYVPTSYITYTVKAGDNLYNIANQYNTTTDYLLKLNNLDSPNLEIGQVLKIKEIEE